MLQKVRNYYRRSGISPTRFECEHKAQCAAGCHSFTGPKEPFVGTNYERGGYPRILFLSLDSGRGERGDTARTINKIRAWAESFDVSQSRPGRHWRETHEMVAYLLQSFKPGLAFRGAAPFLAHTNSAKCCQNKHKMVMADNKLFRNCRQYIGVELKLLKPDVVITQGKKAYEAVRYAISCAQLSESRVLNWAGSLKGSFGILHFDGREVLWLATLHPAARGGVFQKQKERYWKRWASRVAAIGASVRTKNEALN